MPHSFRPAKIAGSTFRPIKRQRRKPEHYNPLPKLGRTSINGCRILNLDNQTQNRNTLNDYDRPDRDADVVA